MPHVTIFDMHNDLFRISVMVYRCHGKLGEHPPPYHYIVVPLLKYELVPFYAKMRLILGFEEAIGVIDMDLELWIPSRQVPCSL